MNLADFKNSSPSFFILKSPLKGKALPRFYETDHFDLETVRAQINTVDSLILGHHLQKISAEHYQWNIGRDLSVNIQWSDDHFQITADAWGRVPVFYILKNGFIWASSHMEILLRVLRLNEQDLCLEFNNTLLSQGYLNEGATPFAEIKKIAADQKLMLPYGQAPQFISTDLLPQSWSQETYSEEWLDELLAILRTSVNQWVDDGLRVVAISGGCDSRLILALLSEDRRKQIETYTKSFPSPHNTLDNDTLIAEQVVKTLGLKHRPLYSPSNYEAFLVPEYTDQLVLSGLYGGEFLGGALADLIPAELLQEDSTENWRKRFLNAIGTSRALYYRKTRLSWASPYCMNRYHRSPFLDGQFLTHLTRLHPGEFANYKIYSQIWQRPEFAALATIPFQSSFTFHQKFPRLDGKNDPKWLWQSSQQISSLKEIAEQNVQYVKSRLQYQSEDAFFF